MLEQLARPPIAEVVCGLRFPPVEGLTPLSLGSYWQERKADFPRSQILPGLSDESAITVGGVPKLRTWFLSEDDVFVLQLQEDRFYLNWRARGVQYPRFSDHGEQGLLTKLCSEFEQFSRFCQGEFGKVPVPTHLELSKIDHFFKGQHWTDFADLVTMIPSLHWLSGFATTPTPALGLRFGEATDAGGLTILLDSAFASGGAEPLNLIKLETRLVARTIKGMRSDFERANQQVNEVFAAIVPQLERAKRFTAE